MEAAETGHLVLSTLHTIDASKTIERIVGVFPMVEQNTIRTRLAKSFRYIVSQRLIPRKDGTGRIAAIEILKSTLRTREYVEKGEGEARPCWMPCALAVTKACSTSMVKLRNSSRRSDRHGRRHELRNQSGNLRLEISDFAAAQKAELEAAPA